MKKLPIALVVLLSVTVVGAAEDPKANIRADFDRAVQAVVAGDAETILDGTYPGLVQQVGGRDVMRSMVLENLKDLERRGLTVVGTEIVLISDPVQAGDELHAVVSAKRTVEGAEGKQTLDTFMIAVSSDGGAKWTFVDGPPLTAKHIATLFPDFNETLEIPKAKTQSLQRKD